MKGYTSSKEPLLSPYRPNATEPVIQHDFKLETPIYLSLYTDEIYEIYGKILSIYECDEETFLEVLIIILD